jgi:hypothetical protein
MNRSLKPIFKEAHEECEASGMTIGQTLRVLRITIVQNMRGLRKRFGS